MIKLNIRDVLSLHKMVCSATGGISEVRDMGILESAIYHSYASFEGKDLYKTIAEKASRHAYGIIRNHPFLDGNKRTGLFVMLVFLELNGIKLKFSQSELVDLGTIIAKGIVDSQHIEKWIIRHKEKK